MAPVIELALELAPGLIDRFAPPPRRPGAAPSLLRTVKTVVKIAAIAAILI